jgi:predicted nuclease of predicted toxin-antitoxin system
MKGNPPRKHKEDRSFGDAIVWESLLKEAERDNLAIITHDSDFISKQKGEEVLNSFLRKEWERKTKKKIELFISLAKFINHFENKQIIKKEIVREEEKRSQAAIINSTNTAALSGLVNLDLGGNYITASGMTTTGIAASDIFSNSGLAWNQGQPISLSAAYEIQYLKFCPYCGESIEEEIKNYKSFRPLTVVSVNRFRCPHCKACFDPERF